MTAGNKLKLQKKLGKRCPECGVLLEVVLHKFDNNRWVSQSEGFIQCPECGYSERKSNHKRDYIKWTSEED